MYGPKQKGLPELHGKFFLGQAATAAKDWQKSLALMLHDSRMFKDVPDLAADAQYCSFTSSWKGAECTYKKLGSGSTPIDVLNNEIDSNERSAVT